MEPQDNKLLAVRKAISAHEEAAAALADLVKDGSDARYATMLNRVEQNLKDLHLEGENSAPADTL